MKYIHTKDIKDSEIFERIIAMFLTDITSFLIIITVVIGITTLLMSFRSTVKLPPGPWGYPIVGHLPHLSKDPLATLAMFRQTYGDIYRIRLGKWPTVVISGKEAIKYALSDKGDFINDRPDFHSMKLARDRTGLTFSHFDERYILIRKIAASALKRFTGGGNVVYRDIIETEANNLVEEMLSFEGKSFDPKETLYFAVCSIIYQVVYGKGENVREDEDFAWIVMNFKKFTDFMKAGNPFDVLPWMRFILPQKYELFSEILHNGKKALDKKITHVKQTYSKNDLRHICDALLTATYDISEEEKLRVDLEDDQILAVAGDLIGAGFDTTATTLRWALLLLASNPIVQEQAQCELDEVLGFSRRPSLVDRSRLPFTEAMTLEVLRMGSTAPLSVPHSTLEGTELFGYTIPKNTVILFNLHSSNYDEQLWNSPYEFNPKRFLDRSGEIIREKAESVLTFGAGRRRCMGENVARMNIFILLSFILQRCKIIKPPEEKYNLKGTSTLNYAPDPFKVKIEARV